MLKGNGRKVRGVPLEFVPAVIAGILVSAAILQKSSESDRRTVLGTLAGVGTAAAARLGMKAALAAAMKKRCRQGESKEDVCRRIRRLPVSGAIKQQLFVIVCEYERPASESETGYQTENKEGSALNER